MRPDHAETTQNSRKALELLEDEHGDHVDRTGRVIVFELYGDPPYMLMIDGKPRARTTTVEDAAGLAARFISADMHLAAGTIVARASQPPGGLSDLQVRR